jgi:ATP-dependent 26S proteasome regulatory subunit
MNKANEIAGIKEHLGNPQADRAELRKLVRYFVSRNDELSTEVLNHVIESCQKQAARESARQDEAVFREALLELQRGPARSAVFISFVDTPDHPGYRRALLILDGAEVVSLCTEELAAKLAAGDTVLVDPKATSVIGVDGHCRPFAGEITTLEKRIGENLALVRLAGNEERCVLYVASALKEKLDARTVQPGAELVANVRQRIAFCAVSQDEDKSQKHFRFLQRSPLPEITTIGAPNQVIQDVYDHVYQEMMCPEIRRRYGLPRSFFAMLVGSPGTGKSHSILCLERAIADLISRHLGIDAGKLPRRTLCLNAPSVISKYLGDSDRALATFHREAIELFRTPLVVDGAPFKDADGREFQLPVVVVAEELDGLAKRRSGGEFTDAMDRILTTFLGIWDPASPELRNSMIIFLATSNRPETIDPAAFRRIGMKTYVFPRPTRHAFEAVLAAQLMRVPLACNPDQDIARRETVEEISAWLFAESGQEPIVDIAYFGGGAQGGAQGATKFRKDLLTHALVNRSVTIASARACAREIQGIGDQGLTIAELMQSIDAQVRATADLLTPENARDFTEVPDGVRVATIKRRPKPRVQKFEAVHFGTTGTDTVLRNLRAITM